MSRKFSIAIVSPRYYPILGGGENQARFISSMLAESGHEVSVIASRLPKTPMFEKQGSVSIVRVPSFNFTKKSGLCAILENVLFVISCTVFLLINITKYEIVYFFWGLDYFSLVGYILKFFHKKTIIRTASMFSREIGNIRFAKLPLMRLRLIKVFDVYVALSKEMQDAFIRDGVSRSKIVLLGNFVDERKFSPSDEAQKSLVRRKYSLNENEVIALYVGHINSIKGVDFLIETVNDISLQSINCRVIIAGSGKYIDDSMEQQLNQMIDRKNINRINFLGSTENTIDLYQMSDIFVLPSRSEGMPNALLEAMACGLACIATTVGAVPEIITDNENGVLIQYGDKKSFAKNLKMLCKDRKRREMLGRSARKTILDRYSVSQCRMQYERIFAGLVNGF